MYGSACGSRENTKDSRNSKENKDSWNSENRDTKENKDSWNSENRDTKENKNPRNTEEDKNSRNTEEDKNSRNSHIHPDRRLPGRAEPGYPHVPLLLNYFDIVNFSSFLTLNHNNVYVQYPNVATLLKK